MNRLIRSRIVRIAYPLVAPATEAPALPALSATEGSAAEGAVAEGSPPEAPAARSALPEPRSRRRNLALPACTERSERVPPALSEVEGAQPPHPACPEPAERARHGRLCSICRHPERDAIEEDFIHWHSPSDIAIDYHLPDRSSVYRHAHATGLFARRSRNLRFVLERLLERVDKVKVTAHAVVRAVRAYTRINDRGEWVEPPTRIIVSSGSPPAVPALPDCTERHKRVPGKATGRSVLIATGGHSRHGPTR